MHSPSCHGTFVAIRGCVLGVPLAVCSAPAFAVPRSQATSHFSPKSLRDFTVSVPLAQEI